MTHPADALHREIDVAVERLTTQHRDRLSCRKGCSACCVDDITVFELEAELIRQHHGELLTSGTPHPVGACAFLDEAGACRIYAQRPYVCRTQGLPLRWIDEEASVECRDICELNDVAGATPITELPAEQCWTLGPAELKLQALSLHHRGALERVGLRALFQASTSSKPSTRR